jgi:hypothetical protein
LTLPLGLLLELLSAHLLFLLLRLILLLALLVLLLPLLLLILQMLTLKCRVAGLIWLRRLVALRCALDGLDRCSTIASNAKARPRTIVALGRWRCDTDGCRALRDLRLDLPYRCQ